MDSRCEVEFETVRDEVDTLDGKKIDTSNTTNGDEETKQPVTKVVGYTKHRRLKLLPPHLIQPRTVHMFYNEIN